MTRERPLDDMSRARPGAACPKLLGMVLLAQVALVAFAGYHTRYLLHPDAICYLRIARYMNEGRWDLAISGYWGPLISWLAAPLLAAGLDPIVAGRIVVGLSAIVYTLGAVAIQRALELRPSMIVFGAALAAFAAVPWSAEWITPDLWLAAFICLGAARTLEARWPTHVKTALAAGLFFGLAYLSKSVALPIACLTVAARGVMALWWREANVAQVLRAWVVSYAALAVVAGPWMGVLTAKYGKPTFSTSAAVQHAIVGPEDMPRTHPYARSLAMPDAGRITSFEEPDGALYSHWSPFDNGDYLKHQIKLLLQNARSVANILSSMNLLGLAMFPLVIGLAISVARRAPPDGRRWSTAGLVLVAAVPIFLPIYCGEVRYFYYALPLLVAATLGMLDEVCGRDEATHAVEGLAERRVQWGRWLCLSIVAATFAAPYVIKLGMLLAMGERPAWRTAAERLRSAAIAGPMAGEAEVFEGLYTAYYAERPFLGFLSDAAPSDYERGGARLVVLAAGGAVAERFASDGRWRSLDSELLPTGVSQDEAAITIFQLADEAGPGATAP